MSTEKACFVHCLNTFGFEVSSKTDAFVMTFRIILLLIFLTKSNSLER